MQVVLAIRVTHNCHRQPHCIHTHSHTAAASPKETPRGLSPLPPTCLLHSLTACVCVCFPCKLLSRRLTQSPSVGLKRDARWWRGGRKKLSRDVSYVAVFLTNTEWAAVPPVSTSSTSSFHLHHLLSSDATVTVAHRPLRVMWGFELSLLTRRFTACCRVPVMLRLLAAPSETKPIRHSWHFI